MTNIIAGVIPDIEPGIRFVEYNGPNAVHLAPSLGVEGTRKFQVFTGPMAGMGPPVHGSSPMNGDTYIRITNHLAVFIRYALPQSVDGRSLMRLNDMMAADSEKILWAMTPSTAAQHWGDVAPYNWAMANLYVDESPEASPTKPTSPFMVMRMVFSLMYDLGRNGNY